MENKVNKKRQNKSEEATPSHKKWRLEEISRLEAELIGIKETVLCQQHKQEMMAPRWAMTPEGKEVFIKDMTLGRKEGMENE